MALHKTVAILLGAVLLAGCAAGGYTPRLVSSGAVVYPADARAQGIEGYVLVRYDIDAAGLVVNPRVVEAEPPGVFDEAALQTVSSWRFQPPRPADGPVSGVQSRVRFSLGGGETYRDH